LYAYFFVFLQTPLFSQNKAANQGNKKADIQCFTLNIGLRSDWFKTFHCIFRLFNIILSYLFSFKKHFFKFKMTIF